MATQDELVLYSLILFPFICSQPAESDSWSGKITDELQIMLLPYSWFFRGT